MVNRIHVIDQDVRRRAKVAHELSRDGKHVEIYEDVLEFIAVAPTDGLILVADDPDGSENALEGLRSAGVALPTIAYAESPPIERVVRVMLTGAAGYLNWPFDNNELFNTLDRMLEADRARQQQQSLMATARSQVEGLTSREREVLTALISGKATKDIARALCLSPRTVEIHRSNMMMKLRTKSVAEAVRIGLYAGLDEVSDWENRAA